MPGNHACGNGEQLPADRAILVLIAETTEVT